MKGVILAGGKGTRLHPLTKVTNKHLLPVYDKPMIYYPLKTLAEAGINDIMIVTGPESAGDFMNLLGSGIEKGLKLTYRIQDEAGGIAQALGMAEDFVGADKVAVILGDNIFSGNLSEPIRMFQESPAKACLFLKAVEDPHRFGVAEVRGNSIVSIEEKPAKPKSSLAVTGLYLYDGSSVFGIIRGIGPSARNEIEITDVNQSYVQRNEAQFYVLESDWSDAGTFESLYRAAALARKNVRL